MAFVIMLSLCLWSYERGISTAKDSLRSLCYNRLCWCLVCRLHAHCSALRPDVQRMAASSAEAQVGHFDYEVRFQHDTLHGVTRVFLS